MISVSKNRNILVLSDASDEDLEQELAARRRARTAQTLAHELKQVDWSLYLEPAVWEVFSVHDGSPDGGDGSPERIAVYRGLISDIAFHAGAQLRLHQQKLLFAHLKVVDVPPMDDVADTVNVMIPGLTGPGSKISFVNQPEVVDLVLHGPDGASVKHQYAFDARPSPLLDAVKLVRLLRPPKPKTTRIAE